MLAGVDDCSCGKRYHAAMAWIGGTAHQDGDKLLMQDTTAVLKLLGMFLTAMCKLNFGVLNLCIESLFLFLFEYVEPWVS